MIENVRNPRELRVPTSDTEVERIWVGAATHPSYVRLASGAVLLGTGSAAPATGVSANIVALTDSSGGTPSNTIADVPGSYTEATLANQLASLTAKVNALIAAAKSAGYVLSA